LGNKRKHRDIKEETDCILLSSVAGQQRRAESYSVPFWGEIDI
jgi:hypothetical protein